MSLTEATVQAVKVLERMQRELSTNGSVTSNGTMGGTVNNVDVLNNDVNTLLATLTHPMLRSMLTLKGSLTLLDHEVQQHPSLLPQDFAIDPKTTELILRHNYTPPTQNDVGSPHHTNGDILASEHSASPQVQRSGAPTSPSIVDESSDSVSLALNDGVEEQQLLETVIANANGETHRIKLLKPPGCSLGFSVVGLKSESRGELGIYVQEIQPNGLAARDGQLRVGDQVLGINGKALSSCISQHQAILALQQAKDVVDLIVSRDPANTVGSPGQVVEAALTSTTSSPPTSKAVPTTGHQDDSSCERREVTDSGGSGAVTPRSAAGGDMVLSTGYAQVEAVELHNDGSGLGFGIIGGRSTGVVVKTILPGGVADRDGRLQCGDHILMIGDVSLRGLGSDQVASVLRQSGNDVRLIVARPVAQPFDTVTQQGRVAPIVETHVLNDPEELDRRLQMLQDGLDPPQIAVQPPNEGMIPPTLTIDSATELGLPPDTVLPVILQQTPSMFADESTPSTSAQEGIVNGGVPNDVSTAVRGTETLDLLKDKCDSAGEAGEDDVDLPELEVIDIQLAKDQHGLGITIAGYVCEKEELSGIFVKSVNPGSAADRSGRVQVNDQIVEVDNTSLGGLGNHMAVDVLRSTGPIVKLKLARYLRGPKYEQLQQAIANSELKTTPGTPNPAYARQNMENDLPTSEAIRSALGQITTSSSNDNLVEAYNPQMGVVMPPSRQYSTESSVDAAPPPDLTRVSIQTKEVESAPYHSTEDLEFMIDRDYSGPLKPSVESAVTKKWSRIVGPELDIVVCQLSKFEWGGGLGVSLEGTVDVEGGKEVRPHHYIRSILPQGPVGKNGVLSSGDELLEVNGEKLLGLNHVEVVVILKELPRDVRIVCARRKPVPEEEIPHHRMEDNTTDNEDKLYRTSLGGSLQNLVPASERLVKAKSDGSLASSAGTGTPSQASSFSRPKSRSLEPLTGLAMWSSHPHIIHLVKGERGLGFSILDYQDPLNPDETVIVIRSLVPGGVAEKDGQLIPGDRLLSVNGINLENASLDQAVAALKGAPKGPVEIAVAKPISVLESPSKLDVILRDVPSPDSDATIVTTDDEENTRTLMPRTSELLPKQGTERSLDNSSAITDSVIATPNSAVVNSAPLPPLPRELHRTLRFNKAALPLGLNLDLSSGWAIVNSLTPDGAIHRLNTEASPSTGVPKRGTDAPIKGGDVIVAVNQDPLQNAAQTANVLKRVAMLTGQCSVSFVPAEDAAIVRQNHQMQLINQGRCEEPLNLKESVTHSAEGSTVINIKQHTNGGSQDEDGPFRILTFRNVTEAPAPRSPSLTNDPEQSDEPVEQQPGVDVVVPTEEVLGSVSDSSTWYGPHVTHYSGEDLLSGNLLTQKLLTQNLLTHNLITQNILARDVNNERIIRESLITNELQTRERIAASEGKTKQFGTLKRGALRQQSNVPHQPHFISQLSECSDSSGDRSSSLYVEVDSDRLSISDADRQSISERINLDCSLPSSAGYDSSVPEVKPRYLSEFSALPSCEPSHRKSLIGTQSLDEVGSLQICRQKQISKQLSEVTPISTYGDPSPSESHSNHVDSKHRSSELSSETRVQSTSTTSIANGIDFGRRTIECQTDIVIADVKAASGLPICQSKGTTVQSATQTVPLTEGNYRVLPVSSQQSFVITPSLCESNSLSRQSTQAPTHTTEAHRAHKGNLSKQDHITLLNQSNQQKPWCQSNNYISSTINNSTQSFSTTSSLLSSNPSSTSTLPSSSSTLPSSASTLSCSFQQTESVEKMTVAQASAPEEEVIPASGSSSITPPVVDELDGGDDVQQAAAKHWGPERTVQVHRDENNSLGIAIVGGHVELNWSGSAVKGIFIKNVLPNSPVGRSGVLKTGDRILEVEGIDLRNASHERAVEVIKNTGNPVTFVVQSLVRWTPASSVPASRDGSRIGMRPPTTVPPMPGSPSPELIQPGLTDQEKQDLQAIQRAGENKLLRQTSKEELENEASDSEDSDSSSDDNREDQGKVTSVGGEEIDRASAGALKKATSDKEDEDNFGYTKKKIASKYKQMKGDLHLVDLQKGHNGLGISLSGHKDRAQMSVFVCGLNPNGNAYKDGRIKIGDEIIEVNGNVVSGRCHLNASTIFKSLPGPDIKIVLLRRAEGMEDMAVAPVTHFPVTLEDESPEEKYARFKGLTHKTVKKPAVSENTSSNYKQGNTGLGIMIIEGKHAEYGQGIFISDLQEGSAASLAGLMVGDMILNVNGDELVGADYDKATSTLRKTEGVINMWVANASRGKDANKDDVSLKSAAAVKSATPARPEPKKPVVHHKPAIAPKPAIAAKPTHLPLNKPPPPLKPTSTTPTPSTKPSDTTKTPPSPATRKLLPSPTLSSHSTHQTSTPTTPLPPPIGSTSSKPPPQTTTITISAEEPPPTPSTAPISPGKETTIEIVKEKMGLGLSIVGGSDTLLCAILIHEVYPDGAAAQDGRLRPGDQILEVSGQNFRSISHQKALSVLRQTPAKVQMVVYREEGTGVTPGGQLKEEDLYELITVQLTKKQGKGLGLSIVGRKKGPGVFISDLVEGGVAESDGRLMQGDQILEVNNTDVRNATQEQAAAILKCAPGTVNIKLGRLKPGKRVTQDTTTPLMITDQTDSPLPSPSSPPPVKARTVIPISGETSPPPPPASPPAQPLPSQLPSAPLPRGVPSPTPRLITLDRGDDGLGFSIVGGFGSNLGDLPIYVKSVFEKGSASREGTLTRGDQILEVNGISLKGLTHGSAVAVLKEAKGTVRLLILPAK